MFGIVDAGIDLCANGGGHARRVVRSFHRFDNIRLHAGNLTFEVISLGFKFLTGEDEIGFGLLAGANRLFELKAEL